MAITIFIETEGLEPSTYREMEARFKNWRPIRNGLKQAFGRHQRRAYEKAPVGHMETLGPSVINGSVASVGRKYFRAGSKVPYATYYNKWRIANGLGPLLVIDDELVKDIADVIMSWTLYGEAAQKIKVPRKRRRKK